MKEEKYNEKTEGIKIIIYILLFAILTYSFLTNTLIFSHSKEPSTKIFDEAIKLNRECSDSSGEASYIICQEEVNYLKQNREILDSGTPKNWATDTIIVLEKYINNKPTTSSRNSDSNIGTLSISVGSYTDIYVGNEYVGRGSAYLYLNPGSYGVRGYGASSGKLCWEKNTVVYKGKPSFISITGDYCR